MSKKRCAKCEENQRKAGETLALFNEAVTAFLDVEALLREVEAMMRDQDQRRELARNEREILALLSATVATAAERRAQRDSVRQVLGAS